MTPDGHHLTGAVPSVRGFFAATGCSIDGLGLAPAIGQLLAELIVKGEPTLSLDPMSITRFGRDLADDEDRLRDACLKAYQQYYHPDRKVA